mgnify:CR=1 FL=1
MKKTAKQILCHSFSPCDVVRKLKNSLRKVLPAKSVRSSDIDSQDLDIYWTPEMAEKLENWGTGTVWSEIQFLMINCKGRVLDIACGTGKTMEILNQNKNIDLFGCDISDVLIGKALERGIDPQHLQICDATKMGYENDSFDYAYTIGSMEHFTEQGITDLLREAHRITKVGSFHMIPVSRSGLDEGWMKTEQSFHNNSVEWWLEKYHSVYENVIVFDSNWNDTISVGKWFLCYK